MGMKIITSGSGQWTPPKFVGKIKVTLIGAGGGGAGGVVYSPGGDAPTKLCNGGGGAGGACTQFELEIQDPDNPPTFNYRVGQGGQGSSGATTSSSTYQNNKGNDGGNTEFGTESETYWVQGGGGAKAVSASSAGGQGGSSQNGGNSKKTIIGGGAGGNYGSKGSGYFIDSNAWFANMGGSGGGIGNLDIAGLAEHAGYKPTVNRQPQFELKVYAGLDGTYGTGGNGGTNGRSGGNGGDGLIILQWGTIKEVITSPTTSSSSANWANWTVPSKVHSIKVFMIAGGGGGGGAVHDPSTGTEDYYCGGGGGGGGTRCFKMAVQPGETLQYSIGKGGAGGTRAWSSGEDVDTCDGKKGYSTRFRRYNSSDVCIANEGGGGQGAYVVQGKFIEGSGAAILAGLDSGPANIGAEPILGDSSYWRPTKGGDASGGSGEGYGNGSSNGDGGGGGGGIRNSDVYYEAQRVGYNPSGGTIVHNLPNNLHKMGHWGGGGLGGGSEIADFHCEAKGGDGWPGGDGLIIIEYEEYVSVSFNIPNGYATHNDNTVSSIDVPVDTIMYVTDDSLRFENTSVGFNEVVLIHPYSGYNLQAVSHTSSNRIEGDTTVIFRSIPVRIDTSNGDFQVPSNVYEVKVTLIGAGGGGSGGARANVSGVGSSNIAVGAGGSGGGSAQFTIGVTPNKTLRYTVGAGGLRGRNEEITISSSGGQVESGSGGDGGETSLENPETGKKYAVSGGLGAKSAIAYYRNNSFGTTDGSAGGNTPHAFTGGACQDLSVFDGGSGGTKGNSGRGLEGGTSYAGGGGGGGAIGYTDSNSIYSYVKRVSNDSRSPKGGYTDESHVNGTDGQYGGGGAGSGACTYRSTGDGGTGLILIEYDTTQQAKHPIWIEPGKHYNVTKTRVYCPIQCTIKPSKSSYNNSAGAKIYDEISIDFERYGNVFDTSVVKSDDGYFLNPSQGAQPSSETYTSSDSSVKILTFVTDPIDYNITFKKSSDKYKSYSCERPSAFNNMTSDVIRQYNVEHAVIEAKWYGRTDVNETTYKRTVVKYNDTDYMLVKYPDESTEHEINSGTTLMVGGCTVYPNPKVPDIEYTKYEYKTRVYFNMNDGSSSSQYIESGWVEGSENSPPWISVNIKLSTTPTRSNYIFVGWSLDRRYYDYQNIGSNDTYGAETESISVLGGREHTLFAIWKGVDKTITAYMENPAFAKRSVNAAVVWAIRDQNILIGEEGALIHEYYNYLRNLDEDETAIDDTINAKYGDVLYGLIDPPVGPEYDKLYKSVNWYVGTTLLSNFTSTNPYTITGDHTITLKLELYTVTVTFHQNGKNEDKTIIKTYDQYVDNQIDTYEDMGLGEYSTDEKRVFLGWGVVPNAINVTYSDGTTAFSYPMNYDELEGKNIDTDLYAVWGRSIRLCFDVYNDNTEVIYKMTDPATRKIPVGEGIFTPDPGGDTEFVGWKCPQLATFTNPKSSSFVNNYEFAGDADEYWFYGVYTQRKYYPVVFVDNLDSPASIAKCMKNEKPVLNWSDTIKTDNGENFNPSAKSWQPYQSSQIFEAGYSKQVKLNKIINVFYRSGAPIYSDDNIHMAISCGEYGIIDLGDIQDISDSYSAMLTTIPIAPFGYSGTFCMDRGVQRSLSVGIVRVSPVSPDDNNKDSRRWSNSKWISMLRAMTDRWQMMTDGVRLFMYVPNGKAHNVVALNSKYSLTDGHINGGTTSVNAYISQLPLSYSSDSVHKISLSMTFRVGTIYPKPPVIKMTAVTLKVGSKTKVIQYPSNSYSALPRCPAELLDESTELFLGWYIGSSTELKYPGDPFNIDGAGIVLNAEIVKYNEGGHTYTPSSTEGYEFTLTVPDGVSYSSAVITAVGGGGAGGSPISFKELHLTHGTTGKRHFISSGGGGGGSGYVMTRIVDMTGVRSLFMSFGKGGTPVDMKDGNSGGRTVVRIGDMNGKVIVSAKGGEGGKVGRNGGAGGRGYNSGGIGGHPSKYTINGLDITVDFINAMNGAGTDGYGLAGANVILERNSEAYLYYSGGGGGGAPIRLGNKTDSNGNESTGSGHGGDGRKLANDSANTDGTFGGGGGGAGGPKTLGGNETAGKGGDGYVFIIMRK